MLRSFQISLCFVVATLCLQRLCRGESSFICHSPPFHVLSSSVISDGKNDCPDASDEGKPNLVPSRYDENAKRVELGSLQLKMLSKFAAKRLTEILGQDDLPMGRINEIKRMLNRTKGVRDRLRAEFEHNLTSSRALQMRSFRLALKKMLDCSFSQSCLPVSNATTILLRSVLLETALSSKRSMAQLFLLLRQHRLWRWGALEREKRFTTFVEAPWYVGVKVLSKCFFWTNYRQCSMTLRFNDYSNAELRRAASLVALHESLGPFLISRLNEGLYDAKVPLRLPSHPNSEKGFPENLSTAENDFQQAKKDHHDYLRVSEARKSPDFFLNPMLKSASIGSIERHMYAPWIFGGVWSLLHGICFSAPKALPWNNALHIDTKKEQEEGSSFAVPERICLYQFARFPGDLVSSFLFGGLQNRTSTGKTQFFMEFHDRAAMSYCRRLHGQPHKTEVVFECNATTSDSIVNQHVPFTKVLVHAISTTVKSKCEVIVKVVTPIACS